MDEVGLLIRGIADNGLLRYRPVGGIDPRVCVSKRVLCGDREIPGVIGAKAIHLQTPADRERVLDHKDLFIDIGAKTAQEAEKLCPPGTYAVFDSPLTEFGDGFIVSRALDDRLGCLALLEALSIGYAGKLTCAFTVQEEVGLRGATVIGHAIDYDVAIALEATAANDLGDVPTQEQVVNVGQGVALSHMDMASIGHTKFRALIENIAAARGIRCQPKRRITGGNDAGPLQRGTFAKPTAVLSVPCRYIHSPVCVASLADAQAQRNLVAALMEALPARYAEILS